MEEYYHSSIAMSPKFLPVKHFFTPSKQRGIKKTELGNYLRPKGQGIQPEVI
jgi:hypothetical protein